MKATKSFGFILNAVATILAVAAIALYGNVLYGHSAVRALLVASIVLGVAAEILAVKASGKEIGNFLPVINSVLLLVGVGLATAPMVNEIAYVYAGLNPMSNIQGYVVFAAVMVVAWLASLITSFVGVTKE